MMMHKLQYITQGETAESILKEVEETVDAGVQWIQLRVKNADFPLAPLVWRVKELCEGKATLIINDRVELAKLTDADGVHLGLDDMPIQEARSILGSDKLIGGTANTMEDCINRQKDGADYIGLGPYRFTETKKKLSPVLGLNGYEELIPKKNTEITIPVLAIGGIELADIKKLSKQTGVFGVAVSSLIAKATNKKTKVTQINKALK